MEHSVEQLHAIKFSVKLRDNATETSQMLQELFKDDCIPRSQCGRWHKVFKEGQEEVADESRSGRTATIRTNENVDHVRKVLHSESRLNNQQIAYILNVLHGKTVNSAFYLEALKRLKCQVTHVRTDIKDMVELYHDNAPSHVFFIEANFLSRSKTPVIPHPP